MTVGLVSSKVGRVSSRPHAEGQRLGSPKTTVENNHSNSDNDHNHHHHCWGGCENSTPETRRNSCLYCSFSFSSCCQRAPSSLWITKPSSSSSSSSNVCQPTRLVSIFPWRNMLYPVSFYQSFCLISSIFSLALHELEAEGMLRTSSLLP